MAIDKAEVGRLSGVSEIDKSIALITVIQKALVAEKDLGFIVR